jgi:hypothetical protein
MFLSVDKVNDSLVGPLHVRLLDPQPDVGGKLDDHPEAVEVVQELHNLHGESVFRVKRSHGESVFRVKRSTGMLIAVLLVQRVLFTAFQLGGKGSLPSAEKEVTCSCIATSLC